MDIQKRFTMEKQMVFGNVHVMMLSFRILLEVVMLHGKTEEAGK